MKMRKRIMAFGLSALILFGGMISVYALDIVNGDKYHPVGYVDIPAYGRFEFNTNEASRKMTKSTLATFKNVWSQAALGNYAVLVNSSTTAMSERVGLPFNKPNWASSKFVYVGSLYFSGVSSHNLEPSNTCDLSLNFSADTLELPK